MISRIVCKCLLNYQCGFYFLDSEPDYKMITDPSLKDLLQKLLIKDPISRINNVRGIRDHKYFDGINWRDINEKIFKAPIN